MSAITEELRLLVDPSFRCSVALVHAVRPMVLELHLADGAVARVSHDPAFRPVLAPCHLRLAMAQAAGGSPPRWLGAVAGWTAGGPFVEPLGGGVVRFTDDAQVVAAFATTLTPMVVRELAAGIDAADLGADAPAADDPAGEGGEEDLGVVLRPDPAVGVTVVDVRADLENRVAAVDLAAVLLGAACREREQALRRAAGAPGPGPVGPRRGRRGPQ